MEEDEEDQGQWYRVVLSVMSRVLMALGGTCQPGSWVGAGLACLRDGSYGVVRKMYGPSCWADLWPSLFSDLPRIRMEMGIKGGVGSRTCSFWVISLEVLFNFKNYVCVLF